MDDIIDLKADSERATLALCRELLGDEAEELSDEQHDVAGIGWWLAHLKNLVADYRPVLHDCRKRCGATVSPISALEVIDSDRDATCQMVRTIEWVADLSPMKSTI